MLKKMIPMGIFLVVCGFLLRGLQLHPQEMPSAQLGKAIPMVDVVDVNTLQSHNLSHWLGQPMLIHFFASWCENCTTEMPILLDWRQTHHVTIIGVDYKDNPEEAKQWLSLWGNAFVAFLDDSQGQFGLNLGVVATPETFLVDGHGIVQYRHQGPLTHEILTREIEPRIQQWSHKHV